MFAVRDIVSLNGGAGPEVIITSLNLNRPKNIYSGVLKGGRGKVYIFGERHRPMKLGVAPENHPALLAMEDRSERRAESRGRDDSDQGDSAHSASNEYKSVVKRLCSAVLEGNLERAKFLAELVQEFD